MAAIPFSFLRFRLRHKTVGSRRSRPSLSLKRANRADSAMRLRFFITLIALVAVSSAFMSAEAQRTTRSRLKAGHKSENSISKPEYDTVALASDSLLFPFSGYEKTLRSSKESFFVTNRSDSTVTRLSLDITYKDMKGRPLDTRSVDLDIDLPAGETRRIDLRSWDRQNVFYYHLSPVPRSTRATPYRVNIRLKAAMRRR